MKIFVIGATGYIGMHLVRHLLALGHAVSGLARNPPGEAVLRALGATPVLGDAIDPASLLAAACAADATVFAPQLTLEQEQAAALSLVGALGGTGKTLVFTSGTGVLGQRTGGDWSEDSFSEADVFTPARSIAQRVQTESLVLAAAASGLRGMVVRPPMVWGHGRFVAAELIAQSVQQTGAACYVGAGLNLYSHVQVDDLALLFGQVLERGVPGALYHAVGGELGYRAIAQLIAQRLGCQTRSISVDEAIAMWGKFATLIVMAASSRSRSPRARQELGWRPQHTDLIDQLLDGRIPASA